ncbi:hypothetical protein GCM10020331_014480 [Ectobacillus funiculus]
MNFFRFFYNICGKFAAIIGPALVGVTAQMTGNTNSGVFSLVVLFILGGGTITGTCTRASGSCS